MPLKLRNIIRVSLEYPPLFTYHYSRRQLFRQKPLAEFDDEHACVFVLSTGRSGTHTLTGLYKLATGFLTYHEPGGDLDGLSRVAYAYGGKEDAFVSDIFTEAFLAARKILLETSLYAGKGYIEASHFNTFLAPYIYRALPSVRFIHITRHPRDFVNSAIKRGWYHGNTYDKNRIVPRPDSTFADQWPNYEQYQKNIWLWTETNRWILEFLDTIPSDKVLQMKAEDVFSGEMETISRLYRVVGASLPSEAQIRNVLQKKLDSPSQREFKPLDQWTDPMLAHLEAVAGQTATRLGYRL